MSASVKSWIAMMGVILGIGMGNAAYAVSTGAYFPSNCQTSGGSGRAWSHPERAQTDDNGNNNSATVGDDDTTTERLLCTGYGFNIPAGATINGITVTIERSSDDDADSRARDSEVYLLQAGNVVGNNEAATGTNYPTSLQAANYGSATDLWGASWTSTDINDGNFGVAFRVRLRDDDDTVKVNYISVAVEYTPDTTPPTVSSINRAGENPTSAPTVQWTVTFSEDVTGVDSTDFQLVNSGLPGTPTITDVSGSGSVYTVTATTGSGGASGTLGLNLADNDTIKDAAQNSLAASGGGADGSFTGQVYQFDPGAASQCYNDDFNRANGNPGSDWIVGNEGGSFGNPVIANQRLRLTNATASASTYASLQRLFPGAGNKIIVEFTEYSYGGSGADGMGIVLSDAAQPLSAGAFGGSMGYAPKQASLGGDTTHEGFAGGWLGIALDEFGNYSNATEGRTTGSASGQTPDSVAIRGSGSGYTGYTYLTGTGTLSPGIDNAGSSSPAPGYRYRIIVDHSDSVHAWTSVERDINDGAGYQFVVPVFDAKAGSGQAAVPTNWRLSYTGATGGSANIHEIDSLKVCSVTQSQPTLHHIELDYSGTTCSSGDITIKACADAACSARYAGPVTVDLGRSPTSNSSWSADPVTFNGGETQVTLTKGNTGSVTITGTATSPAPASATRCFDNGVESSPCVMNFVSACFGAVESGNDPATPIYTKLVGAPFTLRILAVRGGALNTSLDGWAAVTLVDPDAASGNCNDTNAGLVSSQNIYLNNGVGSATFTSSVAAKNVKVRMMLTSNNIPTCSLDSFAIRPAQFALSTDPASGPFTAGKDFKIIANAGVSGVYDGTPALDTTKISFDPSDSSYVVGAFSGNFPQADGVQSQGTFQYQDVADTVTFQQDAVYDANFTAVDQVTGTVNGVSHGATPDCVPGSTSATLSNSRYGCTLGSAAASIGRFIPDHFSLSSASIGTRSDLSCSPASGFTYIGEPVTAKFTLTAQNANNQTTVNYTTASGRAKLNIAAASNPLGLGAVNADTTRTPFAACGAPAVQPCIVPQTASGVFVAGMAQDIALPFAVYRDVTAPRGPYSLLDLGIAPVDSDGVKLKTYDLDTVNIAAGTPNHAKLGRTDVRYGRLVMSNAYGSELLKLPIDVRAEYWNGNSFVLNTNDSCTAISTDNMVLQNYRNGVTAANLPPENIAAGISLAGGEGKIILNPPSPRPATKGSADICIDAGADASCTAAASLNAPWLQGAWNGSAYDDDPVSRATFGIYKSGPVIYLRELY